MPKSAPERLTVSIATREFGVPERCVHIGDRASDIYEFFCLAQDLGANFLERFLIDLHHTPPRRSSCRIPGE